MTFSLTLGALLAVLQLTINPGLNTVTALIKTGLSMVAIAMKLKISKRERDKMIGRQ